MPDSPSPTTRDALLGRIRGALGRERTVAPAPLDVRVTNEAMVRLMHPSGDLTAIFLERARSVGMTTHVCPAETFLPTVESIARSLNVQRVAISIEDPVLRRAVDATQLSRVEWSGAGTIDPLYDADAGVIDVFAALAETGSLVVRSSTSTSRGGFLVPPYCIVLVRSSQILPDMVDLWRRFTSMPTSIVVITGPSKTADIEGVLITGVHGPKGVHVVVIHDAAVHSEP